MADSTTGATCSQNFATPSVIKSGAILSTNEAPALPARFALQQNYPNPFNPSTTIRYDLPQPANVVLEVFNTAGQQVAVLVNGLREAGSYEVTFDARSLASGAYIYRLRAGDHIETRKMLYLR